MSTSVDPRPEIPRGDLAGLVRHFRNDVTAGFLVFLIALPLCLGISLASGYPPLAGIFTAIVGAIVGTVLGKSEMTIKGPAAGLIVIAVGCIESFGGDGLFDANSEADWNAYRAALAVGVAAAALQLGAGLFRVGILGDFFPISAVHGMLAAIGVIIIAKQIPVALGVSASGEPLELLREIPHFVATANPAIAVIGIFSLLILLLWPWVGRRWMLARKIPSPVIVLAAAVPFATLLEISTRQSYELGGSEYPLGEQFLVAMPAEIFGMFQEITTPDFSALQQPQAWGWVFLFFAIGSLESVLSAKAVELLDPWKRTASMDRDLIAVGIGNLCVSCIGGLPMISEIVRSKANIDNGARTRFANFWHGMFLLSCVALLPTVLHQIPLAALAAMLVYTGFRLAHPREFYHAAKSGREPLLIFVTTMVAVLATDLLIGIAIGIAVKAVMLVFRGVPLAAMFRPGLRVIAESAQEIRIQAGPAAVFSNWIALRRQLEKEGLRKHRNVILDLSQTRFVDHSLMDKLNDLGGEFRAQQLNLTLVGLESLQPITAHSAAARRRMT